MQLKFLKVVAVFAVPALVLSACGDGGAEAATRGPASDAAWVLASEPVGASSVAEAKASASAGDEVVLRGRIGGRKVPMSGDSPVFTIVDLELLHCGQTKGDVCPTPWDYCCETPESMVANTATVQVVDVAGRPIEASPAQHGFAPLDEVVVVGVVAARPDARVLTVRATGIHRVR